MNKVVPILSIIISIAGLICSLVGMALAFSAFAVSVLSIAAVMLLFISCIINAFSVVGGFIFTSKLCKAAMIIGICAYAMTIIGFITLFVI